MATGDIKSAVLAADGWTLDVTVEGLATGGTVNLGIGSDFDPADATVRLSVTRPGYTTALDATTYTETVVAKPCNRPTATIAKRKAYNQQAVAEINTSGSDVVISLALSSHMYTADTMTVTIDAGFYTQGGTPNNAVSALAVTNNSALTYAANARTLGDFAILKADTIRGTSFTAEVVAESKFARNGSVLAGCRFTMSDGTNTLTQIVNTMTVFPDSPNGKIVGYSHTFDLSGFIDLASVTCRAELFPWCGNSTNVRDTNDGVNTWPTVLYCNWRGRLDKTGKHGHAVVDPVGGNDGTGAVYASQALAEAGNAYLTAGAALTALATYNNTNAGHNDAGGGFLYFPAGTHYFNSSNGGTTITEYVTVTRKSNVAKADCIFSPSATNAAVPRWVKFYDVTMSGANIYNVNGNDTSRGFAIVNCVGNGTMTNYMFYAHAYGAYINNTGQFGTNAITLRNQHLLRGNSFTVNHNAAGHIMVGNVNCSPAYVPPTGLPNIKYQDGGICAFNVFGALTTAQTVAFANTRDVVIGYAFTQNLMLRYSSATEPIMGVGMDGNTVSSTNIIIRNNTVVGGRCNFGYNDTAAAAHYHTAWFIAGNYFTFFNNKDDVFITDSRAIGGASVGYHVDGYYNHYRAASNDEWLGESLGLGSISGLLATPLSAAFVQDNSYTGANTSGGDYHMTASSPGKALVKVKYIPYDLEGNSRSSTDSVGVYRYYVATSRPNGISIIEEGLTPVQKGIWF